MRTMSKLPMSETHEKSSDGHYLVMKEQYAAPYRESVAKQLRLWLEGKPEHNHFANECCPDFSCCKPELLWPEDRRKAFSEASPLVRESMLTDALAAVMYPEINVHVVGTVNPGVSQH